MALSSLAEAGYVLFEEGGRLGVWRKDIEHGVDFELALLNGPTEYRQSRKGPAVTREALLAQTPVDEAQLDEAAAMLAVLAGKAGDELTRLMAWGWEFPDDGRVSFSRGAGVAGAEIELLAHLDRKDHIVWKLDGEPAAEADALAWLQREDGDRSNQEVVLLTDLLGRFHA
ncbi:MAG: hypothetical protein ACYC5Y_15260 [Symbiobacteriia bacterium]